MLAAGSAFPVDGQIHEVGRHGLLITGKSADDVDQFADVDALEDIAVGSGMHRIFNVVSVAVGGENKQFHLGIMLSQQANGGYPRKTRHIDIDQRHIRRVFFDLFHRLEAIVGLADKVDVGILAETHAQSGAQQGMIIG